LLSKPLPVQLTASGTRQNNISIDPKIKAISWLVAGWAMTELPNPITDPADTDPAKAMEPQALLCTDSSVAAPQIVEWFVLRWQLEVTFEEARAHLGIETQRQWSDLAILRTTPALLGLFSLVTLFAHHLLQGQQPATRQAAWYTKEVPTFSDTLAFVRQHLWPVDIIWLSPNNSDVVQIPRALFDRLTDTLAFAT
jgi:hypothetical protein